MKKIILITGIHGVGKSYLCDKIKAMSDIPVYTASTLIKMHGVESDRQKRVENAHDNQNLLKFSIENYIVDDFFILDGHTCLLDKNSAIEDISPSLEDLNIIGVISVVDKILSIQEKLKLRDDLKLDIEFLKEFQARDSKSACDYARKKNIPFIQVESDEIESAFKFISACAHKEFQDKKI